jgi:hypothetical protein
VHHLAAIDAAFDEAAAHCGDVDASEGAVQVSVFFEWGNESMPTADGRQFCIIYLSGVGDGLRWLLPLSDEFAHRYSVLSYVTYQRTAHYRQFSPDQVNRCDLLICHPTDGSPFSDRDGYAGFLERFPASTRKIFVPWPQFAAFWPFHRQDRESLPLPMHQPFWPGYTGDAATAEPQWAGDVRGELPSYPFGDGYVLGKWQEGLPPAWIIADYLNLDIASLVDLDGLLSGSLSGIEEAERAGDVKIADFVATMFRERKLFAAPQLAGNLLLLYIANHVLRLLSLPEHPERLLDRLQPLIKMEAPIHPGIGRFFGLPYVAAETRYLVDRHRSLTFAEYVRGYVASMARERQRLTGRLSEVQENAKHG